jgi:uncharacterized membrane protein YfcA
VTHDIWTLLLGALAGLTCGFLNTAASSGSAVSLPILMMVGLDPLTANATNRIPVLVGALSATGSFHRKGALPWRLAGLIAAPVTLGALAGAGLAEIVPGRDLGIIITAAVMVAFVLLFTKLKAALERAVPREGERFGWKHALLFFGIGLWLGFIVLDGATYLLLALVLAIGLPLLSANAVKSFALVPTALVALALFAWKGVIDWEIGLALGLGSVVGGLLGAKLSAAPNAKRYIYALLVVVIGGEIVHLAIHYVFETA